jgi:hypothetical protein
MFLMYFSLLFSGPELHIERFLCDNCCFNCETSYRLRVEFGILGDIVQHTRSKENCRFCGLIPVTFNFLNMRPRLAFFSFYIRHPISLSLHPFLVFLRNRVRNLSIDQWIYKSSAATPGFETSKF